MRSFYKSSTTEKVPFLMVASGDGTTGATGLLSAGLTVTIAKNGGSFAAPTSTVIEMGNGWYALSGANLATDLSTVGTLIIHAEAAGAMPTDFMYNVIGFNPFNGFMESLPQLVDDQLSSTHGGSSWGGGNTVFTTEQGKILPGPQYDNYIPSESKYTDVSKTHRTGGKVFDGNTGKFRDM